jgi:hypothetical protein
LRERSFRFVDTSSDDELQLTRGQDSRRYRLSRLALLGAGAAVSLFGVLVVGVTGYLLFRDDVLAGLLERQAQMQYSYEDRLAAARLRLDQATSRQMLDQDSVEGKVQKLVMREAMLETRAAVVAQLVERAGHEGVGGVTAMPRGASTAAANPANRPAAQFFAPPKQAGASESGASAPAQKPQPEGLDLRLGQDDGEPEKLGPAREARENGAGGGFSPTTAALASAADPGLPIPTRLANLALSLDYVERDQASRLFGIVKPALAAAAKLRQAFDAAGLPVERYVGKTKSLKAASSAVGGPFVATNGDS